MPAVRWMSSKAGISTGASAPTLSKRPELVTAEGPWGGPVYAYRSSGIRCAKGGNVCGLFLEGHPLHGHTFGVVGTITPLVDI